MWVLKETTKIMNGYVSKERGLLNLKYSETFVEEADNTWPLLMTLTS